MLIKLTAGRNLLSNIKYRLEMTEIKRPQFRFHDAEDVTHNAATKKTHDLAIPNI